MGNIRIRSLYLQNNAFIFTGLNRYEVFLDLTDIEAIINIIIGEMGSCKSVILGHLQPFHSFGTLDNRNQEKMILEGVDGKKVIIYDKGSDEYVITHNYIFGGKTHTVKSYIEKNSIELNPNGNQGSFREIILNEFGLDQDYLRLLRLGPNVTNFISMKSTERKSYISSLLQNTEVYTLLYKRWSDENRELNSKSNVLANKLNHIGADKEAKLREEYETNQEMIDDIGREYNTETQKLYQLIGERNSILNGMTEIQFEQNYNQLNSSLSVNQKKYSDLIDKLHEYDNAPSIEEITKILGRYDQILETNTGQLSKLEKAHKDTSTELNVLKDTINMSQYKDHIDTLESTYKELQAKDELYRKQLSSFKCEYTSTYLTGFIGDLQTINILIEELAQRHPEDLKHLYNSDSSVVHWAQKKVEILTATKYKLQKQINNIRYSDKYEAPGIMYLPPFCPTKNCPYYNTHPYTLKKSQKDDNVNEELVAIQQQIEGLDVEIYRYSDYSYLYTKMVTLKELWRKSYTVLDSLHALRTKSLIQVLTNLTSRTWYSYDTLIQCVEMCEKRESYYELTESLNKIKNELNMIKMYNNNDSVEKLKYIQETLTSLQNDINIVETSTLETTQNIKKYNQIYLDISQLSIWKDELNELSPLIQSKQIELSRLEKNKDILEAGLLNIQRIQTDVVLPLKNTLQKYTSRNEEIKSILNDIEYTKVEFASVMKEKEYMKHLVDATSSKEGIPLVLIMRFLNNCRDIVNELIYDVFEDDIEIQKFVINEDEFKIPFTKNGILIDDIEKASQGQRSIASLAISFGLIRQSNFEYDIILLDEVDGPLYKNDRNKFLSLLFKQIKVLNTQQIFLISHNNTYEGFPVNVIMTTDEIVEKTDFNTIVRV